MALAASSPYTVTPARESLISCACAHSHSKLSSAVIATVWAIYLRNQ